MGDPTDPAARIAYLEGRVEALEEALRRRSDVLRRLQEEARPEDLLLLSRLEGGLPPLPLQAYDPERWQETTDLSPADVETTMKDLWKSLGDSEDEDGGGSPDPLP